MRILSLILCLALCACYTNARGRVDPTVTAGVWGGALVLGGAVIAAGTCQPTPEQCDTVERGSPVAATALVLTGAAFIGLAYLFHRIDNEPR